MPTNSVLYFMILFSLYSTSISSELGASFGDAAVSQILRHAASKVIAEPRIMEILLKTKETPSLGPLAHLDILNRVAYKNLSVQFHPEAVHIVIDRFSMLSHANLSYLFWPLGMGDQLIDMNLEFNRGEIRLDMDEFSMSLGACLLDGSTLDAGVREHWLADKSATAFASLMTPVLDSTLCNALRNYVGNIRHTAAMRFPVHDLIPEKARKFLATNNTTLYYRLKNIEVSDHQLTARAQLEWIEIKDAPAISLLEVANRTVLDIDLGGDDRVTVWLEDAIINELLGQVDWNFEWMNERIPVTSPVIPPDSREFLSTLCTQCYFQVNVGARGQPTLSATNNSLVLEKRDRVHLQVVNPDRNITSVFVAFILTIQAEVRPSFDGGTLRTLVQLLDTNIEMESGAFPKNWGLFMQDLMRGMIMDMLWPEIKNAIEELSYGKGVRISRACGVDPSEMSLNIGEGNFSLTSRLVLQYLDPEKCIKDMKSSLPSTSKIFQKIEQK